ncbi:MAG: hypothetical protein WB341_07355 [Terracidiphilus sp.]
MATDAQSKPAPGYGIPPANTGNWLLDQFANASMLFVHVERRFDPFFSPLFDVLFRDLLTRVTTALINLPRKIEGLKIAEERPEPDEAEHLADIIATMGKQMQGLWKPGNYQRGGNTKTHGIVRGEFIVRGDIPENMRRGIFATARSFPAWVRFSGPGPYITPDIDDVGFMSISIKLMDVPGPKLMDDEKFTQDMFGVSTPTFVTCDTKSNADLQHWSLKNAPIFHFINPGNQHVLDLLMQSLWIKTQSSPLESQYFSCVPYLLGEGQAMQYSVRSRLATRTPVPRLPLRPPDNYLRDAMVATLAKQDVEFDVLLQLQTDPHLMPIENNGVFWSPRLSPRIPAAILRIPQQKFDSPEQLAFAKVLSYNPWHCIPEHRPLGNQSRARLQLYKQLSTFRQAMNDVAHYEPTGNEVFSDS